MNYYNENDKKAAQWIRELIKAGEIPDGVVDERSIIEIKAHELHGYNQCHFFAGIAGWAYALKLAGWPSNKPVWTGSCPCQPFSQSGKQLGTADARHLWPVFCNLIGSGEPPVVFGEQVASALGRQWLAGVFADLERLGYHRAAADLCAAGAGSPHIRQWLYWVAYADRERRAGNDPLLRPEANRRTAPRSVLETARSGAVGGVGNTDERQRNGGSRSGEQPLHLDGAPAVRLEYSPSNGREQRGTEPVGRRAESGRATLGLGDDDDEGSQGRGLRLERDESELPPWSSGFDIIQCTDGKSRRVESGTFPLAHGVSGRVGLLRGYGNAIVPQVAAEFIQACEEGHLLWNLIG